MGKSSPAGKSKEIRDLFNIGLMEPEWTLPSCLDSNPMVWYISVNGFIMDARSAPREIQEVAFAKGLIPYIPAERGQVGPLSQKAATLLVTQLLSLGSDQRCLNSSMFQPIQCHGRLLAGYGDERAACSLVTLESQPVRPL